MIPSVEQQHPAPPHLHGDSADIAVDVASPARDGIAVQTHGLAVSGLALFIVGLVVAAAFAISARRQLRMIGLLSATAGADERHVRRLAILQGALCGGAGVIAQARARVRALLPRSTEAQIGFHERRATEGRPEGAVVDPGGSEPGSFGVAIGGPELFDLLGAEGGRAAFDRGEVAALAGDLIENGHVTIKIPQVHGPAREVRAAASEMRVDRPIMPFVISTAAAARLGLSPTRTEVVFRAPRALTAAQQDALQTLAISYDRGSSTNPDAEIHFAGNLPSEDLAGRIEAVLLAIAALLTLAVVASGLALSTAGGKADDTTLVALGADPATRRRFRATQAGLLVAIAGLLALPAGLIPATVIIHSSHEMRFAIPWTAATIVLIALPATAAAGAWLLTRPARWSPPATWAD